MNLGFLSQPTNVIGGVSNFLGSAGNWLGNRAADVATGLGLIQKTTPYKPTQTPTPTPTPTNPTPAANSWATESAALQSQLRALQNQLAQQPKLPNFDILANYNKAKQTASAAVTPLYNQKLNNFLEAQGIKKVAKTQSRDLSLQNSAIAEQNALADNNTSRVRTGEDLSSALQQIDYNRNNALIDDGRSYDDARRALQEEIAAGGATDTGLGQQAVGQQQADRNMGAQRQQTAFTNEEAAKKLLSERTFADLATSDTRNQQKRTQDDKATNIDFDSYMQTLANEGTSFKLTNDLEKAMAIAQQTQSYQQQGVAEFLAGLASKGYRGQDIALAKQVYG